MMLTLAPIRHATVMDDRIELSTYNECSASENQDFHCQWMNRSAQIDANNRAIAEKVHHANNLARLNKTASPEKSSAPIKAMHRVRLDPAPTDDK